MRKLIVTELMSLDGYVAGPGGDVMVLPLDESFSGYNVGAAAGLRHTAAGSNDVPWLPRLLTRGRGRRATTRDLRRADAHTRVAKLKEGAGGEIPARSP